MFLLGLLGWVTIWRGEGQPVALKVLPMLALCLFLQQGAVFVHLGLNVAADGRLRERLGMPTTLTTTIHPGIDPHLSAAFLIT